MSLDTELSEILKYYHFHPKGAEQAILNYFKEIVENGRPKDRPYDVSINGYNQATQDYYDNLIQLIEGGKK